MVPSRFSVTVTGLKDQNERFEKKRGQNKRKM